MVGLSELQKRVLYVGEDANFIRGFVQSVVNYADKWDLEYTTTDHGALAKLSETAVDVLITDYRSPGIDGNELLEMVSQQYPTVMRFVLSDNTEGVDILISTRLAHQFISIPCDFKGLLLAMGRSSRLRETLMDIKLVEMITGIKNLPSLPTQYIRLVKMLQSENATLKDIGDLISQDVTMTAKLLQLVNSAFFGVSGKVNSPHRAVSLLGLNTIKALVLVIQLFEEFQDFSYPGFSLKGLWRHSIAVGTISKEIAAQAGMNSAAQDDAHLTGVLHDIGKLIQVRIPGFFRQVKLVRGRVTLESEYESYQTSHAEIGAYLLDLWAMPEVVVEAVAFHHRPANHIPEKFGVYSIVNIASGLDLMLNAFEPENNIEGYVDMDHLRRTGMEKHMAGWMATARRILQNGMDD